MRGFQLALTLALLFGASPAPAAAPEDRRLASRLRRIETAFRDGDAAALRGSCAASGKVRVDLSGPAPAQGAYAAGQLQVIFGQIFRAGRTREFAIEDDVRVSAPGTAFARGRWVQGAGGRESELTLTFTLREEDGDWRVREIRSTR
jgi:hypothetical protein